MTAAVANDQALTQRLRRIWDQFLGILQAAAISGELGDAIEGALGVDGDSTAVQSYLSLLSTGGAKAQAELPPVELAEAEAMAGAKGAYVGSLNLILINRSWLATASDAEVIRVLAEEYGHSLDAKFNTQDTAGDEGERFAALLLGYEAPAASAFENDTITVTIDGVTYTAEAAVSTPTGSGTSWTDPIRYNSDNAADTFTFPDAPSGTTKYHQFITDTSGNSSGEVDNITTGTGAGNFDKIIIRNSAVPQVDRLNTTSGANGKEILVAQTIRAANGTSIQYTVNAPTDIDAIYIARDAALNPATISFTYTDSAGSRQTVNTNQGYVINGGSGTQPQTIGGGQYPDTINGGSGPDFMYGDVWATPAPIEKLFNTSITGETFTRSDGTNHFLTNGQPVTPISLGSTSGLTLNQTYYVIAATATTFQVATTRGGSAVNLTGSNSSVNLRYEIFRGGDTFASSPDLATDVLYYSISNNAEAVVATASALSFQTTSLLTSNTTNRRRELSNFAPTTFEVADNFDIFPFADYSEYTPYNHRGTNNTFVFSRALLQPGREKGILLFNHPDNQSPTTVAEALEDGTVTTIAEFRVAQNPTSKRIVDLSLLPARIMASGYVPGSQTQVNSSGFLEPVPGTIPLGYLEPKNEDTRYIEIKESDFFAASGGEGVVKSLLALSANGGFTGPEINTDDPENPYRYWLYDPLANDDTEARFSAELSLYTQEFVLDLIPVNDEPEQTGTAATAIGVLEDSVTTETFLGLSELAYSPGAYTTGTPSFEEKNQTLTYTITNIPSFIEVFKPAIPNSWMPVTTSASLTLDELKALSYKTRTNAFGTDSLRWTVTDNGGTNAAIGDDNTLLQTLAITVTAVNDPPEITSGPQSGAVTEAGNLDNGTVVAGTSTATGTLTATDVDGDVLTWSLQESTLSPYGSMVIGTTTGQWTYTLNNDLPATQALKEGQSFSENYTAIVADPAGASDTDTITIRITGTNDAPVIIGGAQSAAVTEAGNLDDGTVVAGTPSASGTLTATDVDQSSGVDLVWSVTGPTTYGSMTISSAGVWTYSLNNTLPATQALKEGQSVTQAYTARVTDEFDASDTESIIVTITGTNDAPVITSSSPQSGAVTEAGNLDNGTAVPGTPSASGTLTASDVDQSSGLLWSVTGPTTYGSITISSAGVWTYSLDNNDPDTQALQSGQSVTQTYTARVTDEFGASDTETITVTITGTNDLVWAETIKTDTSVLQGTSVSPQLSITGNLTPTDKTSVLLKSTNGTSSVNLNSSPGGGDLRIGIGNTTIGDGVGEGLAIEFNYQRVSQLRLDFWGKNNSNREVIGLSSGETVSLVVTGINNQGDLLSKTIQILPTSLVVNPQYSRFSNSYFFIDLSGFTPVSGGPTTSAFSILKATVTPGTSTQFELDFAYAVQTDLYYGTINADTIICGAQNDQIYAFAGNDSITAGGGDDWIWAGRGDNRIDGGLGNDTFAFQKGDSITAPSTSPSTNTIINPEAGDRIFFKDATAIALSNPPPAGSPWQATVTWADASTEMFQFLLPNNNGLTPIVGTTTTLGFSVASQ